MDQRPTSCPHFLPFSFSFWGRLNCLLINLPWQRICCLAELRGSHKEPIHCIMADMEAAFTDSSMLLCTITESVQSIDCSRVARPASRRLFWSSRNQTDRQNAGRGSRIHDDFVPSKGSNSTEGQKEANGRQNSCGRFAEATTREVKEVKLA